MKTNKASLYKLSDEGIIITSPEDGVFEAGGKKERVPFSDFVCKTVAADARFGVDIHARRIGHEIRDAFQGKKAGEDSGPLSLAAAHALWAAIEKPTGGYSGIASQMPTSWLYAVPASNELPALDASAENGAAFAACKGCGKPADGHTHCEKCGGHSGIEEGKPGACTCNAEPEAPTRIEGRCVECGAPKAQGHACEPEALERARAVRAAVEAHTAKLAELQEKETPQA